VNVVAALHCPYPSVFQPCTNQVPAPECICVLCGTEHTVLPQMSEAKCQRATTAPPGSTTQRRYQLAESTRDHVYVGKLAVVPTGDRGVAATGVPIVKVRGSLHGPSLPDDHVWTHQIPAPSARSTSGVMTHVWSKRRHDTWFLEYHCRIRLPVESLTQR
jgi:hypothetical protein